MDLTNEISMIKTFLKGNGYKEDSDIHSEYQTFNKDGVSSIDINISEIVIVGERGAWLYLPVNFYALLGALIHHRQLACDYAQ